MFFKKSSKEFDILPPPPPFPELKIEDEAIKGKSKQTKEKTIEKIPLQKPTPKIKGKLKFKKEKKQKAKADTGLEELRKELLEMPKPAEKRDKKRLQAPDLTKTPEMPEIGKPIFEKKEAKKKAKEEKRKAREERKKQKKTEKELAKQKRMEEKERIIKGKTETEIQPFELFPHKVEKPPEIFKAEHEINKAIKDLKKKPKKPLFSFLKKKEKLPKPGKTPKVGSPEKLPPLEIKAQTDEVSAIKHKIHGARSALMNFDLKKAKILYIKTMKLYQNLSPEKQALVYGQIKELYNERMHAEGLKFKQ